MARYRAGWRIEGIVFIVFLVKRLAVLRTAGSPCRAG